MRRGTKLPRAAAGALCVGTIALSACGGDDAATSTASAPAASTFPPASGRTLEQIVAKTMPTDDIVALPTGQLYRQGRQRFGFGLFTDAREPVNDAQVAIYAAPGSKGMASGPYPARVESLATDAAFASETTSTDPDAAKVVYTTDIDLDRDGEWRMIAVIREGDRLESTRLPSIKVGKWESVPAVGEKPPKISTPTSADVGGDLARIDTRQPPDSMHEDDFADVVGTKPVVLLFATPALCQSRVCGPVTDIAEQVKDETGDDVSFIHMEIFEDNQFDKGPRAQVEAFGLPSEPWLFVFDADGRISTAIEGAFGADELRAAIERASP